MKTLTKEILKILNLKPSEIESIGMLKKGMTNKSYLLTTKNGEKYIIRTPGAGTDKMLNRSEEKECYRVLKGHDITQEPIYIDSNNGIKISTFIEDAHVCNVNNPSDIMKCMQLLRTLHVKNLSVPFYFDLKEHITLYERLRDETGKKVKRKDYDKIHKEIMTLIAQTESKRKNNRCLCHIDAVSDNFLFFKNKNEESKILLIDWEYGAMQDPLIDIAMFSVYSSFCRDRADYLIDCYFSPQKASREDRLIIYSYIAICSFMWSIWSDYKCALGSDFGEYGNTQYSIASHFIEIIKEMENEGR